ncbi:TRM11 family SAM-dependent methyltransferase [Actinocrispum wychmicini]|nr:SAM-dependent methyltransferase [Actinocrispum wychmicini]
MPEYAVLISPSTNRVYTDTAQQMMRGEIQVFAGTLLDGQVHDLTEITLGGVPYLRMRADDLSDEDIAALSNLSSVYALFEMQGELLKPLRLNPLDRFSSDLLTILKYSGKTNEQFTKLLLNVTAVSTDSPKDFLRRPLRVLDPMCGRGTTLNQATMYGFDSYGVDLDGKDFEAYSTFIRTWLKNKRLKHTAQTVPMRRNRENLGKRLEISFGATKEEYKAGEVRTIDYVHADTLRAKEIFGRETFDIVVTDTPYGVQHGSTRESGLSRSPLALLESAVPVWTQLIRPGGALGLSWNTYVGGRDAIAEILRDNGLQVLETEAYLGFQHRVDQAIVRDLMVARKG